MDSRARARAGGWLDCATRCPSPNFDERPETATIDLIVIHGISLPPGHFGTGDVHALFTNRLGRRREPGYRDLRRLRVSSHFLIERDGGTTQFVSVFDRAWHAGVSSYRGRERCNDFSIGIELEGTDAVVYTDAQYASLVGLAARLATQLPSLNDRRTGRVDARRIVGHSDIAPGRKTDPGNSFDWLRLRTSLAG
jgi:AmpD protein